MKYQSTSQYMRLLITILFCLLLSPSFAQRNDSEGSFNYNFDLAKRASTPQSPEAAAFGRYGDISVNMYMGTPNISVPIYIHKGREFDLPINLTYDASGILVNQLPTAVGLGWNLNVGGRISRQVNGLPDDYHFRDGGSEGSRASYQSWYNPIVKGEMNTYSDEKYHFNAGGGGSMVYDSEIDALNYLEFLRKMHEHQYETQPDVYSVYAPGLNDSFIGKRSRALQNPNIEISKVSGDVLNAPAGGVTEYKVISDNGTQYFFEAVEESLTQRDNDTHGAFGNSQLIRYTSSWYLTKIISPLEKDVYEFIYSSYTDPRSEKSIANLFSETTTNVSGPSSQWKTLNHTASTRTRFLGKKVINKVIHNDKVIIEIDAVSSFGGGPDVAITGITTFSNGTRSYGSPSSILKHHRLEYSYFKTRSSVAVNTSNSKKLRLKLDRVVIEDDSQDKDLEYTFDYIQPNGLPEIGARGQDYLGYNNGRTDFENTTLLRQPSSSSSDMYPVTLGYTSNSLATGSNRNPNFDFGSIGLLKEMSYPTGGHSVFEYEQATHRVPNDNTELITITKVDMEESLDSAETLDTDVCNKQILNNFYTPRIFSQNFTVNSFAITHHLSYSRAGTPIYPEEPGNHFTNLLIIKVPAAGYQYTWEQIKDSNCDFLLENNQIIYKYGEDDEDAGADVEKYIHLDNGEYQAILVGYDPGYTKKLTITETQERDTGEYDELKRAGIRINSIKDYSDASTIVKQKEYTYLGSKDLSSPQFEYLTKEGRLGDDLSLIADEVLHVVSQPVNGGKEHMVYGTVVERIKDPNDSSNQLSKTYSFKTPNTVDGHHGIGGYQTYLLGRGYSGTNYSKRPAYGTLKRERTETTIIEKEFTDDIEHYSSFGLAIRPIGMNSPLYPVIVQDDDNKYRIKMLYPEQETTLGGDTIIFNVNRDCVGPDCRPEIARLGLHKTNLYGYHGAEVEQVITTTDNVSSTTSYEYTGGYKRYLKSTIANTGFGKSNKTNYIYSFFDVPPEIPYGTITCVEVMTPDGLITMCGESSPGSTPSYLYSQLVNANMLSQPVIVQQFEINDSGEHPLSTVYTDYEESLQPQRLLTSRGDDALEPRMHFERYDQANNLIQARQEHGRPVSFIWGYNNRYVVAKIENLAFDDIPIDLLDAIKDASDLGHNSTLETHLNTLRNHNNLSNSLMSSYLYKPNIGVVKTIDPTGYSMNYFYDELQRLSRVEDRAGNVLSENAYNYKN